MPPARRFRLAGTSGLVLAACVADPKAGIGGEWLTNAEHCHLVVR